MSRWIAAITLPLTLLFAACDSEPVDEHTGELALQSDDAQADDADAPADLHARAGQRVSPSERLCAAIECTDDQSTAIAELFAKHRPQKGERRGNGQKGELQAAGKGSERRAALAESFRQGTLQASDMTRERPERARSGEPLLVELHALLTPEQRAQVGDMIAERGPRFLGGGKDKHGKRGKGKHEGKRGEGKRDGKRGDLAAGERGAKSGPKSGRMIEKLCTKVECTDDQRSVLLARASELHPAPKGDREARRAERSAARQTLATAFRGDNFSAADLEGMRADAKAKHEAKAQARQAMVLELQTVLTPEQRGVVADMIAERGLHGLLGKKGHGKRGKKGERGEHGKRRGKGPRPEVDGTSEPA